MRLARSPVMHFLFLGAVLFVLLERASNDERAGSRRIVVTRGRIESLADGFLRVWRRPPTPDELKRLVDDSVREEVYYREALALGLDRDDWFLRQHLRRKLEFLRDDPALTAEPTDEDLQAHLTGNPAEFSLDGRLPPLEEVRAAVEASWRSRRRREALDAYYLELRKRYEIRWPPGMIPGAERDSKESSLELSRRWIRRNVSPGLG